MKTSPRLVIDAFVEAPDYGTSARDQQSADAAFRRDLQYQRDVSPQRAWLRDVEFGVELSSAELLDTVVRESAADAACLFVPHRGGEAALSDALAVREQHPGRVFVKAAIVPARDRVESIERIVELAARGVDGVHIDPYRRVDDLDESVDFSDEDATFPLLEACLREGVRVVSVRKNRPRGLDPLDPYRGGDIDYAARAFPEISFEVVHAGLQFLDEFALQLSRFPNVWANLAITNHLALRRPRRFAEILGELLLQGQHDKILFGSATSLVHPQPLIDALEEFEMPLDMVEDGYPEFTDAMKSGFFGRNFARLHGLDPAKLRERTVGDKFDGDAAASEPRSMWSSLRSLVR